MTFTCPVCGITSHNPRDEEEGYCGNCHGFTTFDPDWMIAPGETIREWLEENGLSVRVGAKAAGIEREAFARLLVGDEPLTKEIAARLSALTFVPASFWLNHERRYRDDLKRGKLDTTLREVDP